MSCKLIVSLIIHSFLSVFNVKELEVTPEETSSNHVVKKVISKENSICMSACVNHTPDNDSFFSKFPSSKCSFVCLMHVVNKY